YYTPSIPPRFLAKAWAQGLQKAGGGEIVGAESQAQRRDPSRAAQHLIKYVAKCLGVWRRRSPPLIN
ncbi:MAG: hypothetical protein ABJ360_00985, partial [Roseobacter sp.]